MPSIRGIISGLRTLIGKQSAEREMDDELQQYLDRAVEEHTRRGLNRKDALRAARVEMGSFEAIKDEVRSAGWEAGVESLWRDIAYGFRMLRTNAGFTAVAILTLALGIGANVAIFSLVNAVMLRLLPVEKPEQLVRIGRPNPRGVTGMSGSFTNPLWEQIRDRQDMFSGTFAWFGDRMDLAQGGAVQYANVDWVSGGYFQTLGLRPVEGRLLANGDDRRGCAATAVLSYGFWQERFGGEPGAIGRNLSLNKHLFQVIGVAPPGFSGMDVGRKFDVAIPICVADLIDTPKQRRLDHRSWWWLSIGGRMKPGVTQAALKARLAALSPEIFRAVVPQNWHAEDRQRFEKFTLTSEPAANGASQLRRQFAQPLRILMGIVAVVLLIACANIASLMMARAGARQREIAVRLALGASRARLVRQLLTESLMLSAAGALAGMVLARWAAALLVGYISTGEQRVFLDLTMDWRVLGFVSGIAILTAILFGLLPAFRSTRVSLTPAMKGDAAIELTRRIRFHAGKWTVGAQIALSLALMVAAGLLVRSFANLMALDLGFERTNVLLARASYETAKVPEELRYTTGEEIETRLRALPGVVSAARSWNTPVSGIVWNQYATPDVPDGPKGEDRLTWFNFISPSYFATLRMPVLSGRSFTAHDTKESPKVAVVTQTMARRFWGGRDPVGRYFAVEPEPGKAAVPYQVVGVVKDSKYDSLREDTAVTAFFPLAQIPQGEGFTSFELRTAGPARALTGAVQSAVAEVNKAIPIEFRTLAEQVGDDMVAERVLALVSGFFGVLALLLATVGLYGTLSYQVTQRQKEMGIRMALGARLGAIVGLVMRDVGVMLAGGFAAGVAISLASTGVLKKMLFGLTARDGGTMVGAIAVLAVVAAVAAWLPARRAARVDPMKVLRHE